MRVYTDIWNDFQFRQPCYLDGHFEKYKFDLVRWCTRPEPVEVFNLNTVKKQMSDKYCFSVGQLVWREKDGWFDFKSVGTRYLEYRIDGLEEFILDFCDEMKKELSDDEYDDE